MSFTRNGKQYVEAKGMLNRWKCSYGSLYTWLKQGKIEGAVRYNGHWYIPVDAECPNKYKLSKAQHRQARPSEDYEDWCRRMSYYSDNYQKNFMEV